MNIALPPFPWMSLLASAAQAAEHIPAVTVKTTGWGWTSYGVWTLVGVVIVALIKLWPAMRKLKNESDGSLRADLLAEVDVLRKEQRQERKECNRQLTAMQNKMDAITRQFVQFQLTVVRWMPAEYAPTAQQAAERLMEVIAKDVDEFAPPDGGDEADGRN